MVVAKSGKGGNKKRKGFRKMCREVTSGLGSVLEPSLSEQSKSQVVNICQYACAIANGETGGIFSESDISSIMRTSLNAPMSTTNI